MIPRTPSKDPAVPHFRVVTDHPVALDSDDHVRPGGTMHDNSRNRRFNRAAYALFPPGRHPLKILDLGCAGGGFVKDCLDDGHHAVGLEGSDYSTKWDGPGGTPQERASRRPGRRAEWATIPDNLFTADITRPFAITADGAPARFDLVTAWEVMEHIREDALPALCHNVRKHLAPDGLWVMSVSPQPGDYHVCVHDRPWWLRVMAANGFLHRDELLPHFTPDDWVRGPRQNAPGSFHLIVSSSPAAG
jgi:SAM-dependent methyltransferase